MIYSISREVIIMITIHIYTATVYVNGKVIVQYNNSFDSDWCNYKFNMTVVRQY